MSNELHVEPQKSLSPDTQDMHRALLSLTEELEAIDWYRQRAEACADPQLRAVFQHNGKEETEHATMLMEWIRRHDPHFTTTMKTYLFTAAPIEGLEAAAQAGGTAGRPGQALGIGNMKEA
jgi:ferritin-like protein